LVNPSRPIVDPACYLDIYILPVRHSSTYDSPPLHVTTTFYFLRIYTTVTTGSLPFHLPISSTVLFVLLLFTLRCCSAYDSTNSPPPAIPGIPHYVTTYHFITQDYIPAYVQYRFCFISVRYQYHTGICSATTLFLVTFQPAPFPFTLPCVPFLVLPPVRPLLPQAATLRFRPVFYRHLEPPPPVDAGLGHLNTLPPFLHTCVRLPTTTPALPVRSTLHRFCTPLPVFTRRSTIAILRFPSILDHFIYFGPVRFPYLPF